MKDCTKRLTLMLIQINKQIPMEEEDIVLAMLYLDTEDKVAYDPDMTVMTASAKSGISLLFTGMFAAIMLISLIPLIFFRLDDKKVEEMEAEISARKSVPEER